MVAGALGGLVLRMRSMGVGKAASKVGNFQNKVGNMQKKVQPKMKKLTQAFKKFGLVATGAFAALIASSPLLRARMEILTLRISGLTRMFGDALAPAIEFVTDLIEGLTSWFNDLDPVVQNAIIFGGTFVILLGLLAMAFATLSTAMSPVTLVILGLAAVAAILYLVWETNFLGIRDLIKMVFAVIGSIFEGIGKVISGFGKMVGRVIGNVIGVFEGIIDFIKAVFSGDLEGAINAIKKIFSNIFGAIKNIIMWPITALKDLIAGIIGGNFIKDIMKFGGDFINAFVQGIKDAAGAVWGIIEDILGFLGDFFGGSLPERGPLKHIVTWGQDLGQSYVEGIGKGVERTAGDTISRVFNIESMSLELPSVTDRDSFEEQFDSGIRRATI